MKYVFYFILILAIASIVFNATKLDINNLLQGESQIGAISIVAALCVAILMSIMLVSYKIKDKYEKN
ncbi:hypothetical protein [Nonlabens sp.]|uniref:hypothetical protein n=1 Tax=Nonlabens sp. TaxID=1888209 RepID=UPI003263CF3D